MAFEVPGLWHENSALHSAIEYRQMLAALIGRDGAPGIFEPGDLNVTEKSGGADGSVDIAIGGIALKGADASAPHQGWYFGWNNAVINLAIDPTGGGSRVDYIVVADEDQEYGDASDGVDAFVVKGTEGAGAPNIPYVTYHVLARLDIPAGTSTILDSMITDTREYCEVYRRNEEVVRGYDSAGVADFDTNETTYLTVDLDIPTDWESYVVEIVGRFHTDHVGTGGSPGGAATATANVKWNGSTLLTDNRIGFNNTTQTDRKAVALAASSEGETATGTITAEITTSINAQDQKYSSAAGAMLVHAIKTSLDKPPGSDGQP